MISGLDTSRLKIPAGQVAGKQGSKFLAVEADQVNVEAAVPQLAKFQVRQLFVPSCVQRELVILSGP